MSISENETNVKRFFNQKRDITYYRRIHLNAKTIKTLMMIRMHAHRKEKLTTKSDTLNFENTKNRAKNHKNFNIYLRAKLYQFFEIFENDNIQNDFVKITTSKENDYIFFNDENFDRKMNDLIDRTCTQQIKVLAKKIESSIQHENKKRRRRHQLSMDVLSRKRRIWLFRT